jgi:uncharacterized protein (TIGR02757 family)
MEPLRVKPLLDEAVSRYNNTGFIADDPISVPHQFSKKEDVEIAGFFAAIMAWGQRKTTITKSRELMTMMGNQPYAFLQNASAIELKALLHFRHRTLNGDDVLGLIEGLKMIYSHHGGLEQVVTHGFRKADAWEGLINLNRIIFSYPHLGRTRKHISNPETGSAAKRLNMYLRWMVRSDDQGVDFGLWKSIQPAQLLCPLDVHVAKTARALGLLDRKPNDRKAVDELTANLRLLDPEDPVKYDFALFGLSRFG